MYPPQGSYPPPAPGGYAGQPPASGYAPAAPSGYAPTLSAGAPNAGAYGAPAQPGGGYPQQAAFPPGAGYQAAAPGFPPPPSYPPTAGGYPPSGYAPPGAFPAGQGAPTPAGYAAPGLYGAYPVQPMTGYATPTPYGYGAPPAPGYGCGYGQVAFPGSQGHDRREDSRGDDDNRRGGDRRGDERRHNDRRDDRRGDDRRGDDRRGDDRRDDRRPDDRRGGRDNANNRKRQDFGAGRRGCNRKGEGNSGGKENSGRNRKGGKGGCKDDSAHGGQAAPPAPPVPSGPPQGLTVAGCKHEAIGSIVNGEFVLTSENHSKPVYKRTEQATDLDVMLYFWDDTENPSFSGWWFGPKVGGDQVWAYQPNKDASTPPTNGWKVPYDGPVDEALSITPKLAQERRREDEQRKQKSALAIRRVIQRVRAAIPETIDALKVELEAVLRQELDFTGPQRDRIKEESDKGLQQGLERVQLMENQRKLLADMEVKRKEEQDARLRQMEDNRRQFEELNRKKQEETRSMLEAQQKKLEQDRKKQEDELRASVTIRRALQKLRLATPSNFDQIKHELEEIMAQELDMTGPQQERLLDEHVKEMEQAEARVAQLAEQEKKVKELSSQLSELVDTAEEGAQELKELVESLADDSELSVDEVEKTVENIQEADTKFQEMVKACFEFFAAKGAEFQDTVGLMAPSQLTEARQEQTQLLLRINICTQEADAMVRSAHMAKDKAIRRAAAGEKLRKVRVLFDKYSKGSENMLSRKEVAAFAKSEYDFKVPEETLGRIWKNVVLEGDRGVKFERFSLLRSAIGVARERERDIQRRKDRIEKEKVLDGLREKVQESLKDVVEVLDTTEEKVKAAKEHVEGLPGQVSGLSFARMTSTVEAAEQVVVTAQAAVVAARQHITALTDAFETDYKKDLEIVVLEEAREHLLRVATMDALMVRASGTISKYREQAAARGIAELERYCAAAVKILRHNQRLRNLTPEELFQLLDMNSDEQIDELEFSRFFERGERLPEEPVDVDNGGAEVEEGADAKAKPAKNVDPEAQEVDRLARDGMDVQMLQRVFKHMQEEGGGTLTKEVFLRHVRVYFKVVKDAAMTDLVGIKGSKTLRRLEVNDVVELLQGPVKDDTFEVMRIRAKVMKDGTVGWITTEGKLGTVFLVEEPIVFKVVKETILTEDFELETGSESRRKLNARTRKLREGELLEVYEWPKREERSGLMRMKARAKTDGAVGWVTTMGNQGTAYAEVV